MGRSPTGAIIATKKITKLKTSSSRAILSWYIGWIPQTETVESSKA